MEIRDYAVLSILALMFLAGAYVYPGMPEPMATHWDAEGNVNGYSSRAVGVFLMPALTLGIYLLFLIIPKIAVYRKNIMSFYNYYSLLMVCTVLFMAVVYAATLFSNLGFAINLTYIIMPALGLLFYGISFVIEKAKRNFFIGIRTPWTLSNDVVWKKTHKIGAKVFRVFAAIAVLSLFVPKGILVFTGVVVLGALYLFVYSYVQYAREKKK